MTRRADAALLDTIRRIARGIRARPKKKKKERRGTSGGSATAGQAPAPSRPGPAGIRTTW